MNETGLELEQFCPDSLFHGLFVVLPSRLLGLVEEDVHQIMREQIAFWAFAESQWNLPGAFDCLTCLDLETRQKLEKLLGLGQSKPLKRAGLPAAHRDPGADCHESALHDQDVYRLDPVTF